jgi:hypothetical protein
MKRRGFVKTLLGSSAIMGIPATCDLVPAEGRISELKHISEFYKVTINDPINNKSFVFDFNNGICTGVTEREKR